MHKLTIVNCDKQEKVEKRADRARITGNREVIKFGENSFYERPIRIVDETRRLRVFDSVLCGKNYERACIRFVGSRFSK